MEWMVLAGAIAGVYSLKLLSPILLASIQKTRPLTDPNVVALVHERLASTGLPALRVELWPSREGLVNNAMVVGLARAPRWFQARIFISESLVTDFSREELDCVLAHEVAHFHLNHLSKRIWIPFSLYSLIVLGGTLATHEHILILIVLAGIAYVLAFSILLRHLARAQELDADWTAINLFGVKRDLYFRTLGKLESPLARHVSHPSVEERRARVGDAQSPTPPFERQILASWLGPVLGLILVLTLTGYLFHREKSLSPREPAATSRDNP